ncbi:cytochrome C biogenesis protein ResC [Geobacter sp. FeAm09]|uniref:cytochrome c biogenesis protein n=1 Tax=Geobacter sp. FeAm09 TaxID=2597769 RepID=UPI0011EC72AD|nr:cytochrome c biogenesis protein CcsA [Geobacter sp. FeAm09]QEM68342.1 cytochrome C biogenesis protein ResC [Geobacter sp. FeAm09]
MRWLLVISAACFLFGSWQRTLFALGLATQVAYMAIRGMAAGRLPLIGPHDTLLFFAASVALMSLAISLAGTMRSERWFPVAAGLASGIFTLFALMFPPLDMPLPQVLDTLWFELHVVLAFFGYGLFLAGGVLGAGFLICRRRALMHMQFKVVLAGWSFFSASMVAGGIWGYYAWGTYWLWTPKELWTSILWLYYALVLHVRLKGAAWERAAAWLGIAGVFVMLFTYLGVSMLMKSSHSF